MSGKEKSSSFLKNLAFYIVYFCTGLLSCFFAFVLVVNFLNPALSQEQPAQADEKKKVTAKNIFRDIVKNLKTIVRENIEGGKKVLSKDEKPPEPLEKPPDVESREEDSPPEAPSHFEGEAYGKTIPSSEPEDGGQDETQASSETQDGVQDEAQASGEREDQVQGSGPPSEASLEVQSYMAPFIYDSVKRKDPFEDPTVIKSGVVVIPKTPPEEYNLSEIKLKGLSWRGENPKALFELPNNAGFYTLMKGDKIGKKGVIFEIRESEVIIVETNYVGSGEERREERLVKIKKLNRVGGNAVL